MVFLHLRLCITITRLLQGSRGQATSRTMWPMTNFQLAVYRWPQNYSKIMKIHLMKIAEWGDICFKIRPHHPEHAGNNKKQLWVVKSTHRWGRRHRKHRLPPLPIFRKCGGTRENISQTIVKLRGDTVHHYIRLHGSVLALCGLITIFHGRKLGSIDAQVNYL